MNTHYSQKNQAGSATVVLLVVLSVTTVLFGAGAVYAFVNYVDQKSNVDARVGQAVATAERQQAEKDQADFIEKEKLPNREYVGPSDYGSVSFSYPKTWSVYVANDGSNGEEFKAYLNPVVVPPVDKESQRFALRVLVTNTQYDQAIQQYQGLVQQGDLKSSAIRINGHDGTRLDGKFSEDIRGAAVLFKIRDKTLVVRTDADTFKTDFTKIIKTLDFNQ
ncbi:hypothetical protein RAAC3_TM7C00001G0596 [Candidatus Saccharibacteria bacterium RAAC3_TM7_1]|nr:hypothetical protein RAAC3_TM7C00001G0596 [Candidatus Saccharibacteria bacterium RAAC3_TM7_1]HCZ28409.1 hypothetical protein [Candidatus Saccharibacteria bacterium]